jgi:hypothetical protein
MEAELISAWAPAYARFWTEQAQLFSPRYWPTEAESRDHILALMGCPL